MVIINRARNDQLDSLNPALKEYGLELAGVVPEDGDVQSFDLEGIPTIKLERENQAVKAAYEIFDKMLKE